MAGSNYLTVRPDWLGRCVEAALEPTLPIVDAHHHFYDRPGWQYLLPEYLADAQSGHSIKASIYMQALTRYLDTGPLALQPVGETAYVAEQTGSMPADLPAVAQGIVGYADLLLAEDVREVLEQHVASADGRFRGVRHLATWDADTSLANPITAAPRHLLLDAAYRAGVATLAQMGLSYDAWMFWPQLPELVDLARAFPDLTVVVDHCGGVVRVGAYQERQAEVFEQWRVSMRELARLPNVHVKLGGLGMRINGFAFDLAPNPPSSEILSQAWTPWMETCIEAFGPDRCMFESNFPVDKGSYSYVTGWNAFKRMTAGYTPGERQLLFEGTASRVYRL